MRDSNPACPSPLCDGGPCRTAARMIVADAAEVPPDCPNRVALADPPYELARLMKGIKPFITARAGLALHTIPMGGRDAVLARLIAEGRLLLLESRTPIKLRPASVPMERPEPPPEPPPVPPAPVEETVWIEIELVKETGEPVGGARVQVRLPDGQLKDVRLNSNGRIRFDDIPAGTCQISFPELANVTP